MQENDNYYTNDKSKYPDSVRFAGKEKYSIKVMVWVAIKTGSLDFFSLFRYLILTFVS